MAKEVKKNTLGIILRWVFGLMFALAFFGALKSSSFLMAFLSLIGAIVLLPTWDKSFAKVGFELSNFARFWIIILLIIIIGFLAYIGILNPKG